MERKALEEMLIGSAQEQIIYLETLQGQILAANVPEKELMEPLYEDWEKERETGTLRKYLSIM